MKRFLISTAEGIWALQQFKVLTMDQKLRQTLRTF